MGWQTGAASIENCGDVSESKSRSTIRPVTPLLVIKPNGQLSCYRDTCSAVFIATLFPGARKRKQLKWHLTNEYIMKMGYIQTMGFYLLVTEKEVVKFAGTWIEPENTVLSQVASPLPQKETPHALSCVFPSSETLDLDI